jgi:hypothetical protein
MTDSTDDRHILIAVSATDCSACTQAESMGLFTKVETAVSEKKTIRFERIKLAKIGSPVDEKYPKALNNWIRFYPIFILVNGKDWNNNFKDSDEKNPNIEVFNATVNYGGVVIPVKREQMMPFENIMDWVEKNLEKNNKFKSSVIIKSSNKTPIISNADQSIDAANIKKYVPTCGTVKLAISNRR